MGDLQDEHVPARGHERRHSQGGHPARTPAYPARVVDDFRSGDSKKTLDAHQNGPTCAQEIGPRGCAVARRYFSPGVENLVVVSRWTYMVRPGDARGNFGAHEGEVTV